MSHIQTQKLSIYSLDIGMFVYKLDRPWAETSYPIEGFHIQTHDELRKLKLICRFVYIDVDKTNAYMQKLNIKSPIHSRTKIKKAQKQTQNRIKLPNQKKYSNVVPLKKAMKQAKKSHQQLQQNISNIFEQFKLQKEIDVTSLKVIISNAVDNMIANPEALMWLARTKNNDSYTYNFVIKQAIWALTTARQIGMSKQDMENLALASILSAIGKNNLPKDILTNETNLNSKQLSLYQKHIDYTMEVIEKMSHLTKQVIEIVKNHCEYIDGSGYPNKLMGKQIPISSQILSIAHFYELNITPRDISRAISPNEAIDKLNGQKNKKFTIELVEQFVQAIGIYPSGSLVQLSNGEIAVIVERNNKSALKMRLQPDVVVIRNTMNEKPEKIMRLHLNDEKTDIKITQSLALGSHEIDLEEINDIIIKNHRFWELKQVIGF